MCAECIICVVYVTVLHSYLFEGEPALVACDVLADRQEQPGRVGRQDKGVGWQDEGLGWQDKVRIWL